ncbi:hypothetical protein TSA1_08340 [Bradyrhizobium nitroreducens]|uniref:ATP-grasp domain-containing protein n=1 Tax=Bradyrhizobium nitroreducens TaxID=709803 RepID=A0A2M6U837_9BRAD|nr:hypothetical protein TSA1_08340 [Bradyrhizobium nitroreducens]
MLFVLGTQTWLSWILPSLESAAYEPFVCTWDIDVAMPEELQDGQFDGIIFVSHHLTTQRDAEIAPRWRNSIAQSLSAASLAFDKRKMASIAEGVSGVEPLPEFDAHEAQMWIRRRPGRAIIAKKIGETEGRGIAVFESEEGLGAFVESEYDTSYILQPFVIGHELSVNVVGAGGRAHFYPTVYKGVNARPLVHAAARRRVCPGHRFANVDVGRIERVSRDIVDAIDGKCLVEIEYIDTGEDLFLVEINPRLAASLRMSMAADGVNAFEFLAAECLGLRYPHDLGSVKECVSIEYPLRSYISASQKHRLLRIGDVQVSSRITVTNSSLAGLREHANAVLDVLEHR